MAALKRMLLCCVVLLSGCLPTSTIPIFGALPGFRPAPTPKDGYVLVYIYRNGAFARQGLKDAFLYLDDVNVADLSHNGYTWLHVPLGAYQVVQRWPLEIFPFRNPFIKDVAFIGHWTANRTYYY